jgi:beta-xylosidase
MRLLPIILAAALMGQATAPTPPESIFAGADPSAEIIDGRLWIYPTGPGDRLQAWTADRGRWSRRGDMLRLKDVRWAADDGAPRHYLWAPDLVEIKGAYRLFYSVGPQDPTPSRLGVAICATPAGPCRDSGKPLLTGGHGFEAIDPMVFHDPRSGLNYLYAGGSNGATLRVFVLDADATAIAREAAVPQPPHFTEGAFMHERGGVYYLSYSHGRWNTADYSVHYATAPTPVGPWRYRGVILQSDRHFKGPGHHSFVRYPDGSWAIAYHRWEGEHGDGPYDDDRRVVVQPIRYRRDGSIVPVVMSRP